MAPGVPLVATRAMPGAVAPVAIALLDCDDERLRAPDLRVAPGERTTVRIRVEGRAAESLRMSVPGLPSGWWSVQPVGTEFTVTLHPPRGPEAAAGDWPLRFLVFAGDARDPIAGTLATLRIGRYDAVSATLSRGRRVRVHNGGNSTAIVSLTATDGANRCRVALTDPHVLLAPGATHETRLLVRPRNPLLLRAPVHHRIAVAVHAGGERVRELEATLAQRPLIPRWWS
jgi:hypothetical protein